MSDICQNEISSYRFNLSLEKKQILCPMCPKRRCYIPSFVFVAYIYVCVHIRQILIECSFQSNKFPNLILQIFFNFFSPLFCLRVGSPRRVRCLCGARGTATTPSCTQCTSGNLTTFVCQYLKCSVAKVHSRWTNTYNRTIQSKALISN